MIVINALGGIGPDARDAIPAVLTYADPEVPDVTIAVARALAKIAPDNALSVPCLKHALTFLERQSQSKYPRYEKEYAGIAETVWELGPRASDLVPELRRMAFTAPLLCRKGRCYAAFALARFASERRAAEQYLDTIKLKDRPRGFGPNFEYGAELLQRIKDSPLDSEAQ